MQDEECTDIAIPGYSRRSDQWGAFLDRIVVDVQESSASPDRWVRR